MKDAFGVEISKALSGPLVERAANTLIGSRLLAPAKLKRNEFWHGTSVNAAEKIKDEGFRLGPKLGRGRRYFGPGVYGTKNRKSAVAYAQSEANRDARVRTMKPATNTGRVLRVAHPRETKLMRIKGSGNSIRTPQTTRAGFAGISSGTKLGRGARNNIVVIANPKNAKVVPERYRITLRLRSQDQIRPTKSQLALKDQMRRSKP